MSAADRSSQLVLCGLGGQGILFLTRVLAEAALGEGREVLAAETHGMAQRGGAVEAHLKIGDFCSSLVSRGRADLVLVLDAGRLEAGRSYVAPDGVCLVNSSAPVEGLRSCDATGAARAMEFARGANLVLLGFASAVAAGRLPAREALLGTLERLAPPGAREANRRAFERGEAAA